jgi:hypothetical protein
MHKINRSKIAALFAKSEGKFFSAGFRKLDGSYRSIEGIILAVEDFSTRYLAVYDTEAPGIRRVNIDTIARLEVSGKDYYISE